VFVLCSLCVSLYISRACARSVCVSRVRERVVWSERYVPHAGGAGVCAQTACMVLCMLCLCSTIGRGLASMVRRGSDVPQAMCHVVQ
jgi:hypothetical protein